MLFQICYCKKSLYSYSLLVYVSLETSELMRSYEAHLSISANNIKSCANTLLVQRNSLSNSLVFCEEENVNCQIINTQALKICWLIKNKYTGQMEHL